MGKTSVSGRPPASRRREAKSGREDRLFLMLGIGFSLFCAVLFGILVFALQTPYAPPDPDAHTPVIAPDFPRRLINFSLVDQSGRAVTRQDLNGKIVVVNFVFTGCAAVCPYVNLQMEKIQQLTAGRPDVRLLSMAMDPVDDTPPVLTRYGETFREDARRWSFLTGDETEMRRLIGVSFLPPDTTGEFAYMPGNFAYTQRIALVDANGHLVEYFDGLNQDAGDAVVKEIAKLGKPAP